MYPVLHTLSSKSVTLLQVSADRVLALPLAADSMAKLKIAIQTANTAKSMANKSRDSMAQTCGNSIIPAFSNFYSHLDGTARCYDIFDAGDTTLWAQALPFSHIFVFPTAAHARRALDSYSSHLVPIAPLLLQLVPAQAGLDAGYMGIVLFRIWYEYHSLLIYVSFEHHVLTYGSRFERAHCTAPNAVGTRRNVLRPEFLPSQSTRARLSSH